MPTKKTVINTCQCKKKPDATPMCREHNKTRSQLT